MKRSAKKGGDAAAIPPPKTAAQARDPSIGRSDRSSRNILPASESLEVLHRSSGPDPPPREGQTFQQGSGTDSLLTRKTDKIRRPKNLRRGGHLPKQEITDLSSREAQDLKADLGAHELPESRLPTSLESTPPETSQMLGPSPRLRETASSIVRFTPSRLPGWPSEYPLDRSSEEGQTSQVFGDAGNSKAGASLRQNAELHLLKGRIRVSVDRWAVLQEAAKAITDRDIEAAKNAKAAEQEKLDDPKWYKFWEWELVSDFKENCRNAIASHEADIISLTATSAAQQDEIDKLQSTSQQSPEGLDQRWSHLSGHRCPCSRHDEQETTRNMHEAGEETPLAKRKRVNMR